MLQLFLGLGYNVEIRWLRKRFVFEWKGFKVCLDDTIGYGYIIELETKETQDVDILKNMLTSLGVKNSPREEFEKKFEYYNENWNSLI